MKTIVQINISLGLINDYKCDPFKRGTRKYCTKDKFCIICSLTYKCMLWMKTKYLSLHKLCELYQQKSTLSCSRSAKTKQSIVCASLRLWARTLFFFCLILCSGTLLSANSSHNITLVYPCFSHLLIGLQPLRNRALFNDLILNRLYLLISTTTLLCKRKEITFLLARVRIVTNVSWEAQLLNHWGPTSSDGNLYLHNFFTRFKRTTLLLKCFQNQLIKPSILT